MRLLQVTTIPETIEAFLLPFAQRFRARGWRVDAAARDASSNEACRASFDAVHDVNWSRNPLDPTNLKAAKQVRAIVTTGTYDLVHVHTPVAAFVTRYALRHSVKPKVLYTAHGFHFYAGGNPVKNAVYRNLEKVAGRWTDGLVVMNGEDQRAALEHKIVPAEKLTFVPGIGIDIEQMRSKAAKGPAREQVRASLGVPQDEALFIMVAEFIERKRHVDAVRAFAQAAERLRAHLLLVGAGPESARVQALIEELGLSSRVHLLGYRRDVPSLIAASDALILVSSQEGLPRSIMEGMALGTPVIGTSIRGVTDLLDEGAGWLVPLGDVGAIAAAMVELGADAALRSRVAAAARQRVVRYSTAEVMDAYDKVYAELLHP